MSQPAYPGRDTPRSYIGREVRATCQQCGHRAYIAPPKEFGAEGYCTACDAIVTWEVWADA